MRLKHEFDYKEHRCEICETDDSQNVMIGGSIMGVPPTSYLVLHIDDVKMPSMPTNCNDAYDEENWKVIEEAIIKMYYR